MAPRAMPRTPHSSLNRRRPSPRRVPPLQSTTRSPACAQRRVGVAAGQLAGDAGEAGAEGERLDPLAPGDRGVHEADQRPGVGLHRAADVEQQHEPAQPLAGLAPVAADRLAAGAQRGPHRGPQVGPPAAARPVRSRNERRGGPTNRSWLISCCAVRSSSSV